MTQLGIALGLAFVLEGVLYSLFPVAMRRYMAYALTLSTTSLRRAGLIAAFAGFALVWFLKA